MTPLPRTVDDRYEVLGVLGEGGTGIVYDAIAPDGKLVAVKVMHAALAGDRQVRGRFEREAAILRRLEGEHVCPILDSGETADGLFYLVLPRFAGPSLAEVLQGGRLSTARAIAILLEVAHALEAAHRQGVIHRDLKPANVLLDGEHVVVVDFGLSKLVTGGGTGTTNLTKHNMLFGTPEYMSPEQARGDELDARSDVYAAGAMLYELLTGAPPFTGESALVVLTAQLTSELVPPSERAPVPPALEAVTLHALARDREARYASAAMLRAALEQAQRAPADVAAVAPEALTAAANATTLGATPAPAAPETLANATTLGATPAPSEALDVNAPTLVAVPSSGPRPPVSRPSRSVPPPPRSAPRLAEDLDEVRARRAWLAAWVVVAIASVATGVWLALRS